MPWADAPSPQSPSPGSPAADQGGLFGVVGLGTMAQALLLPLLEGGLLDPATVRAAVATPVSAQRLSGQLGLAVSCDATASWRCPTVLLAVKPQQLEAVAAACDPRWQAAGDQEPLLISVLAGVRLERLQRLFPGRRCVRAVPNTPALVAAGLTGLAWGEGIDPERRAWVRSLFERVGEVLELPEGQLDPFLALTSSGPAFLALVAEAMADGAVAAGLPRVQAQHLAQSTMAGTAALLQGRQLHPAQLKDMVSSPGGTTIAGLRQLERGGLRSALIEAVVAAAERSRELA
jgi:pyrroline-5-carboxylate reductase